MTAFGGERHEVNVLVPGVPWASVGEPSPRGIDLSADGPKISETFRVRPEKITAWDSGWLADGDVNRIHRELVLKRGWVKSAEVSGATVTVVSGEGCDGGADGFIQVQGENIRFAGVVYQLNDDCKEPAAGKPRSPSAVRFTLRLSEWMPRSVVLDFIRERRENGFLMLPLKRRN